MTYTTNYILENIGVLKLSLSKQCSPSVRQHCSCPITNSPVSRYSQFSNFLLTSTLFSVVSPDLPAPVLLLILQVSEITISQQTDEDESSRGYLPLFLYFRSVDMTFTVEEYRTIKRIQVQFLDMKRSMDEDKVSEVFRINLDRSIHCRLLFLSTSMKDRRRDQRR